LYQGGGDTTAMDGCAQVAIPAWVGSWVEFSRDKEILALLALIQQDLRRRGYRVTVEILRNEPS
jgi:hypothetical protein